MLVRLMYVSEVSPGVTAEDLSRLVAHARRRNRQLDVTGALLKCDGHFAQVLEGRQEAIAGLIASIAKDPRHSGLDVHHMGSIAQRQFQDWDMAFLVSDECGLDIIEFNARSVTADEFVASMLQRVEEKKASPF